MMNVLWILFQILIGYNLILPIILYLIGYGKKTSILKLSSKEYDYAIIVTAYEETSLIPSVIESILKLSYSNYLVYVVADKCDVSGLSFADEKVILLQPETVLASNTKSHFYAIKHFRRKHEVLTIIDSDNLVDPEYLNELNAYFNQGFKAVQGLRSPKSLNSAIARLDAVRDMYYHFYDGENLFAIGSSSTLSGSGMAFKTSLFTSCLEGEDINGAGFDKVLQAKIVMQKRRIAFAEKAIVYDEKTKSSSQLVDQRSRWINTWFRYSSFGFDILKAGFKNTNINQLLFGLVLLRPPLFIFISLSFGCLLINIAIGSSFVYFWCFAFFAFFISFYLALKRYQAAPVVYKSLLSIPKFICIQFVSLFFARNAKKRSVATKHQLEQSQLEKV